MTIPSGNGESRGLEMADDMGSPLPGRTARSESNDRNLSTSWPHTPCEQSGTGSEGVMYGDTSAWAGAVVEPGLSDPELIPGDAGHTYGGS